MSTNGSDSIGKRLSAVAATLRRPMWRHLLSLFLLATVLTGCDSLVCGDGTIQKDGQCVTAVPTRCGPGTMWELGFCVPDPDAPEPDAADIVEGQADTNPETPRDAEEG